MKKNSKSNGENWDLKFASPSNMMHDRYDRETWHYFVHYRPQHPKLLTFSFSFLKFSMGDFSWKGGGILSQIVIVINSNKPSQWAMQRRPISVQRLARSFSTDRHKHTHRSCYFYIRIFLIVFHLSFFFLVVKLLAL